MTNIADQIKADREAGAPGPWRVNVDGGEQWEVFWEMVGPDERCVFDCTFVDHEGGGVPPKDHDARRISRVPMLEDVYLAAAEVLPLLEEALTEAFNNSRTPEIAIEKYRSRVKAIANLKVLMEADQ